MSLDATPSKCMPPPLKVNRFELENFFSSSAHSHNEYLIFHWSPSSTVKCGDSASREIVVNERTTDSGRTARRTTDKHNASAAYCWRRRKEMDSWRYAPVCSLTYLPRLHTWSHFNIHFNFVAKFRGPKLHENVRKTQFSIERVKRLRSCCEVLVLTGGELTTVHTCRRSTQTARTRCSTQPVPATADIQMRLRRRAMLFLAWPCARQWNMDNELRL